MVRSVCVSKTAFGEPDTCMFAVCRWLSTVSPFVTSQFPLTYTGILPFLSPKHPQLPLHQGHLRPYLFLRAAPPRAPYMCTPRALPPNHCNVHTVYTSVCTHASSHIRSSSQASQPARFCHPRGGPEDAVLAKGSAITERPERGPGEPGYAVAGAKPAQHADHAHGGYHAAPPQRNWTITGSGCAVLRLRVVRAQRQHHPIPRILRTICGCNTPGHAIHVYSCVQYTCPGGAAHINVYRSSRYTSPGIGSL